MKLNEHFKKFIANISLNPTRVDRIESAINNWETKFKEDEMLKDLFVDYYTQGSYSTDTGVRPKNREEFDVDVVLVLDLSEEDDPKEVLHLIKDRIRSHKDFEDRVSVKERCVQIKYANEFHVDVVPAFEYEDMIKIPSRKENDWIKTNPTGFKDWVKTINKDTDYYSSKIVKILKHWRDENVGEETAPKSILLTTLVGNAMVKESSIAETLIETLTQMVTDIESLISKLENDEDVPFVENPSLKDENLARKWSKLKAQRFLNKLTKLEKDCREAMDETDKEKSIEKWQEIFGKNYFPKDLGEANAMANQIQSKSVFVSSAGFLTSNEGTRIKDHRFYGGTNE